jgi:SAM-dependent methyltransferase
VQGLSCSALAALVASLEQMRATAALFITRPSHVSTGAQPCEGDRDEPVDRGCGRQVAGRCQGVQAVAREFVGTDIISDAAGLGSLGEQVSEHVAQVPLCSDDVLVRMQECCEFGAVGLVPMMLYPLVVNERVGPQHRFEPLACIPGLVSNFGELFEAAGDLTFVPGGQDRFDVGEVLVQCRPSDPGLLGDLRHRHRRQPVLGDQRHRGVQGRVPHRAAVAKSPQYPGSHVLRGPEDLYTSPPPWDIGRPQPALLALADAGSIRGRVLDAGCGTGEHVLMAADLGLDATGVDLASTALHTATEKARDRGRTARFLLRDARTLADLGESFDTVLDCGLFHILDDNDRLTYVDSPRSAVAPGGRYFMLCFSDQQPSEGRARVHRVTRGEITSSFADGWRVESIEPATIDVTTEPDGIRAWLVAATRI